MKFVSLLLLFFAISVQAGEPPFLGCKASHLACAGKIERLYLHPTGMIYVAPPAGFGQSDFNCTLNEGAFLTLKPGHVHFDKMYALLLSAIAAKKDVYLRYVDQSQTCDIHYAVIY